MFDNITETNELRKEYERGLRKAKSDVAKKLYQDLLDNIDNEINVRADKHFAKILKYIKAAVFNSMAFEGFMHEYHPHYEQVIKLRKIRSKAMEIIEEKGSLECLSHFRNEINKMTFDGYYGYLNIISIAIAIKNNSELLSAYRLEGNTEVRSVYSILPGNIIYKTKSLHMPMSNEEIFKKGDELGAVLF